MFSERYKNYFKTPEWQKKRNERLNFDDFTCQYHGCGNKRGLQVHHLNYLSLFTENVHRDLITVCEECHKKLEEEKKKNPLSEHEKEMLHVKALTFDFCKLNLENDYSGGGNINLCKNDVIRPLLYKHISERGGNPELLSVKQVNDFFRDKRYEVMGKILAENPNIKTWELQRMTGFKYNMVDKWMKEKRRNTNE